jgi:arylsulfatase A-like enzyme/Tfp pilus assembly protein PilF
MNFQAKRMANVQKKNIPEKPRSRKRFSLLLLLAVALVIVFFAFLRRDRERVISSPGSNVLLITLDTTRADRMGYAGNATARTPNLDRLAAAGVHCQAAYSPVPLTLPAHCTIFSGLYPPAHLVRNNGSYSLPGPIVTLAEILAGKGYRTSAFISSFILDSRFGLDQGFAVYDDGLGGGGAKTYHSERGAAATAAAFSRWLTGHDGGRFFSWVHFYDPHAPYEPPEPFRGALQEPYDGEVAYMDHHIGEIIALLEKKHLLENTLVVIAGDHGEAFGEHGENGHQVFCYEENLRVPLIFHAGGFLPAGLRLAQPACLVDVMPTILEFLRLPIPAAVQGRSLLPAMQGTERPAPDLYLESFFGRESFRCAPILGLLRRGYKYLDLPRAELYDLRRDPGERNNLVSGSAVLARKMKQELRALARRLSGAALASGRRMSDEERQALASLGYISSSPASGVEESLPDPKDKIAGWETFTLGNQQALRGQAGAAEASLLRAIELIPDYVGSYTTLAKIYLKQGRSAQALDLLLKAKARLPGDSVLITEYADLLIAMNQPGAALVQLQELAKTKLLDKEAYVQAKIAGIYEAQGNMPAAIAHYRRATAAEPENGGHARKLAYLLHRSNRFAEALEIYLALERQQPEDVQLVRDMAVVYAQLNDLERAAGYFAKALRQAPDANLYFNYALLLARRQAYSEAAAMMEKFLELAPAASAQAEAGRRHLASWRGR